MQTLMFGERYTILEKMDEINFVSMPCSYENLPNDYLEVFLIFLKLSQACNNC